MNERNISMDLFWDTSVLLIADIVTVLVVRSNKAVFRALPETELESVRRVLRTPPARRRVLLGTALFAESPVTPISLPAAPPTSILKSNKRKESLLDEDDQGCISQPFIHFRLHNCCCSL